MFIKNAAKVLSLIFILTGLVALPRLAPAKEPGFKQYREKIAKDLNLSPEKQKEFQDLGDKFLKERLDLYKELNQAMDELKKALAATPVDEAKVKTTVDAATVVKDKLWANYQDWWHGEMKLLTPVQQAQYLMALDKWWGKVMGGHHGMGNGKKGH
jgi:Spy/CpxP family protein refolding chaperone